MGCIYPLKSIVTLMGLILSPQLANCLPNQIKIGILLQDHQYEQELLFKWSIEQLNQRNILDGTKLIGLIERVIAGDSWSAQRKACYLIDRGVIALIGPHDEQTSQHVGSICDFLEVLHLNVITRGVLFNTQVANTNIIIEGDLLKKPIQTKPAHQSSISIDMSISHSILIKAYLDISKALGWKDFVYIYENENSLYHLQEHFTGKSFKTLNSTVKILRFEPSKPYREQFWALKRANLHQIVLDIHCSNVKAVLDQAQQVSMLTETDSYLIICLDSHTIDLENYKYSKSRIIWLKANHASIKASKALSSYTAKLQSRIPDFRRLRTSAELELQSCLIYDAIEAIANTLQIVNSSQYIEQFSSASCSNSKPWPYGSSFVNHMRTSIDLNGMSGRVRFDPIGQRTDYALNVLRLTESGPISIGNWSMSQQNENKRLVLEPRELLYLQKGDPILSENDEKDLLIVTSIINEPYFMNKQTVKIETGNSRYEGYAIDLIDELSRIVGFDYQFKEVDDGEYGKYDHKLERWDGMIHEIMSGKADLAVADLGITSARKDVVDFTLPYMSTGISMIFKKPTTKELELFAFLSPFQTQVWYYVSGAYVSVSLLLFVVGRISPYEWADPNPCWQEENILRNQFTLANSFWFTMAALMQQGSDLAPRSLSSRLTAAIWYFFTLIMVSSYTANLAAFLTVERLVYPFERAEDLYRHPQGIRYGCTEGGTAHGFFRQSKADSTFQKMYHEMVLMRSDEEGKAEVEKGNYAFFMESSSIEYTIERRCNLTQIGGLLDGKGYGIALAKNSTRKLDYRTKLSEAILSLQESGVLAMLKSRWWKEKLNGGACDIEDGQGGESVKELSLANFGGVFVVLGIGILISMTFCGLEIYFKACQLASLKGASKWSQVKQRIQFAISLRDNY